MPHRNVNVTTDGVVRTARCLWAWPHLPVEKPASHAENMGPTSVITAWVMPFVGKQDNAHVPQAGVV